MLNRNLHIMFGFLLNFSMCFMLFLLCITDLYAIEAYAVNSTSRTLSRIDTEAGAVNNSFAQLGLTPNLMDIDAEYLYVVCSGDNAIQVISRQNGSLVRYIPVASSSNPYDVLKVEDYLYVSGLFTNKVYKISLLSNSVVGSVDVGIAPEGLACLGSELFVCNTGGYSNNYANSSISVIDLESFTLEATIPVWTNPQYAIARNDYLHVSCTGNWTDVAGKVDVIDLQTREVVQRLGIGGNPGSIWISPEGTAYVGEGMGAALYCYDADDYTICHDAQNPLSYNAYAVTGNQDMLVLLDQNWGGNSHVRIYDNSFTELADHTVGISATDVCLAPGSSSENNDSEEVADYGVYPNPASKHQDLHITIKRGGDAEFMLFNLRGQKLMSMKLDSSTSLRLPQQLASGIYPYRIISEGGRHQGKLLLY
jgi:hypothetical protein